MPTPATQFSIAAAARLHSSQEIVTDRLRETTLRGSDKQAPTTVTERRGSSGKAVSGHCMGDFR